MIRAPSGLASTDSSVHREGPPLCLKGRLGGDTFIIAVCTNQRVAPAPRRLLRPWCRFLWSEIVSEGRVRVTVRSSASAPWG